MLALEKTLGSDDALTLKAINNLGTIYWSQGRIKEAEAIYKGALPGLEKALGSDHTSTLHTIHNLGLVYSTQGRLDEAEAMYERVL